MNSTAIVMQNDANPYINFKAGTTNVYNCFIYKPVFDDFSFAESSNFKKDLDSGLYQGSP